MASCIKLASWGGPERVMILGVQMRLAHKSIAVYAYGIAL